MNNEQTLQNFFNSCKQEYFIIPTNPKIQKIHFLKTILAFSILDIYFCPFSVSPK